MEIRNIIDISMDLNEKTVVWKDDAQPELKPILRQPKDPVNFTWLNFGSHAGTHVDAPFLLFKDKWASDEIPLKRMIGECQVLDLTDVEDMVTEERLRKCKITKKIVLLKTKNSFDSMDEYNPKHVAMTPESAEYLIEQGVTCLGYDYQSFEREGKNEVHKVFLAKKITLIDNLRLKETEEKDYFLICLPIKVTGIDGAPARAILIDNN